MEEVVQTLVEEGTLSGDRGQYHLAVAPTELQIPPTVQGILAARIDRLASEEKELLQQLSVIGRQFPVSLVKQVVTEPEDVLYRVLSALQAKEFLYEQPAFPESEYFFKHALTQDVAYGTVLQEQRRTLHERTGQALEELYAKKLADHYSALAHRYSQCRNTQKAVEYLYLAGQQAVQRSAHAEAVTRLTTALELLQTLPDGRERAEQELRLQLVLGPALVVNKSYTALEIEHTYARALELSRQMEDSSRLFPAMKGLYLFSFTKGTEFPRVCELGEQLVRLADEAHSPALQIEAYYALGIGLLYRGELSAGRTYLEQAVDLYDPHQQASLGVRFLSGEDPGVSGSGSMSYALWTLGYPEQARQAMQRMLMLAQELLYAFSIAYASAFAAGRHLHYQNYALAQEYAEAAITSSTEHGFVWWHALADIFCGGALAAQGQPTEGIAQIQQGLEVYQSIGAELWWPYYLAVLAEAYKKVAQPDKGLSTVADALARVSATGERWYEAELYRLKRELTLQKSKVESRRSKVGEEAEECFHKALDIAQKQEAKSLELRAATSLARLWQQQGKNAESHELLAPVYNWFTEGFDTADLKDARALLDELS